MISTLTYRTLAAAHLYRARLAASMKDDRGEVNIVAIVLLIVVAIGLVLVFQEQLTTWLKSILGKLTSGGDSVSGGAGV